MSPEELKQYLTPRTQKEATVMENQVRQKLNTLAFFGLSAGAFGLIPVIGVALGVGAGVYCTCKVFENHKLATENLNLFHAMKKETSVHSATYKELGNIADTINHKNSTIGNIWENIKKLREIEKNQKNTLKLK